MENPIDYRDILRAELENRIRTRPHYSLRAYARDLGVAVSRLSEVLRHKKGLSTTSAKKMAQGLGLSPIETTRFIDLILSEHSRSRSLKLAARARTETWRELDQKPTLTLEAFKPISDWYCLTLLELLSLDAVDPRSESLALRLGISVAEIELALGKLSSARLIEKDPQGQWRVKEAWSATPSDLPSSAVREFHRQMLSKAQLALGTQGVLERDFSTLICAIPEADIPELKTMLQEFRRKFSGVTSRKGDKNRVFALSMQFFALDVPAKHQN